MNLGTFYLPPAHVWPIETHIRADQQLSYVAPQAAQLQALLQDLKYSASLLQALPIKTIIDSIDHVAALWHGELTADQHKLIQAMATISGYSVPMVEHILVRMTQDWRSDALWQRLELELGDPLYLDTWRPYGDGLARLYGPSLTWHIAAGNVPGVAIQSVIDGLLLKSPALIKPSTAEPLLAAWWVQQLATIEPTLAASLAVIWWQSGDLAIEDALLSEVDAIQINGSNQAVEALRKRLPAHIRLIGYGSRISCSLIAASALNDASLAQNIAYDVALFDQQGCVSPHLVLFQGDHSQAQAFAQQLTQALDTHQQQLPIGPLKPEHHIAQRQLHQQLEWRELAGAELTLYHSPNHTWHIVIDAQAPLQPVPCPRTVIIRPWQNFDTIKAVFEPYRAYLQSVGLAAYGAQATQLANQLAHLGVTRITRPGTQGWPMIGWLHDGQMPLHALGRWVQWE